MGLTIGVDIGGTKIAAGVVDEVGTILETHKVPTPSTSHGIVDAICTAVAGAGAGHEVEAVGIGAAGYVDDKRATVLFAPNIDWRHEPLKDKVEQRTGLPVVVENDANAAAWGEYRFGAGQGHDDVICITLGTGLGGGIIMGNKLRRGRFGVAAEFGHIRVVPDGLLCGCGNQGCWEQYASGRALVRYARQRAYATPENAEILLGLGDGTIDGIEGKHISAAARRGDPVAVDSFRELARWAGAGLADLASLFDPSAFIVGGGVSDEGELVLDPIRKSFRRWLVGSRWRPHAQVLAARLGG
ncbi:ROK family glucokinase, partial [Streptomyces sp. NPDC055078]